ncbi:RNA methyltransferase, RsmE family [Desulfocapsa sulfexigens DSM 10523]|uniref:Ribosomal RNA small subunit methyltransferase E n=1 Tax=Desulfocapsa sulfexigens (strain DSM 10523 / SB164P1) TaxID=1167006 RepID=M1ND67_DESSD|nr:16S rRNA (uracil(1498)-N(3))-methyltransferase [Desulfocapsa sulfexigens]AGF77704.1 RNA methyltransferase, RsmE family [Desulfocapsa sulfexigens DSM 10523]
MRRFFIQPDTTITPEIFLSEQESHHISKVLRLSVGTPLQLLDGKGNIHDAEIVSLGKQTRLRILSSTHVQRDETPLRVHQSILKGQKMELLVQKCTELGVFEFTPFYSDRCQLKKAELDKVSKKYERWQRIVEEACKQCNNPIMMQLNPLLSFNEMLVQHDNSVQKILFWEEEQQKNSLHSCSLQMDRAGLQIVFGPEGGFPVTEVEAAKKADFQILSLGPRVLKAETANIAAVSIIQHLLGNM